MSMDLFEGKDVIHVKSLYIIREKSFVPTSVKLWKEKKNSDKVSIDVVRRHTWFVENGIIIKAFDKIKAADNPEQMLGVLDWGL